MSSRVTYVLVHGAFTDASCWWPIALRLLGSGCRVLAPPVSMRSLADDGGYIRRIARGVEGPVILVGHDYGAAVVAVAGSASNVAGTVFVNGYVPDSGESIAELRDLFPAAEAIPHLVASPLSDGQECTELSVDIDRFPLLVAEGVSDDEAQVMAVSQRPIAVSALTERAAAVAWRGLPTWGVVSAADRVIHPELQRFGCRRALARRILELDAPHLVMHTHPAPIVDLLLDAATEIESRA
ncbi:alpha/beta hydrolase [Microbacterium sp. cx-55]|uniref:alpha/beta hydrolase n=1 Tax=Microbacterium sp. cx-55 TaxID=2875948 RepID=UPI001CBD6A4A|nr:alpha/beta hydrolase [Microbacterium sp. cx-55]MBZ4486960.1 alpha/beta hydrolase [Microbacterium sp. cx-55]UGB35879.1 alpha/beta hydrolase [Microbacterium sp. cx-55]